MSMVCARCGGNRGGRASIPPAAQSERLSLTLNVRSMARLMREMGLEGAIRGKPLRTTVSDKAAPCPLDKVNRQFRAPAPNLLWLSDFTYVATWAGFVYVAFVIDAHARRLSERLS